MDVKLDCKHYRGEKPCELNKVCWDCDSYSPIGFRALVVKFGAMGDALRTTPILRALRNRHPKCQITWITDATSFPILEGNPLIDRLWLADTTARWRLEVEEFDLLLSFDKVPQAIALATLAISVEKFGFKMSKEGALDVFNPESEYALKLGIDDELKFRRNTKTYQEIMFEMARLRFDGEEYVLMLGAGDRQWARQMLLSRGWEKQRPTVGLNTGSGQVFATKKWTEEGFIRLANLLYEELGANVLLLGGPSEVQRNQRIRESVRHPLIDTGCENTIPQFKGILDHCDLLVTGDTLAMHMALALKKKVVALFGSTCPQEIHLYGRGEKIVGEVPCAPCYLTECNQQDHMACMKKVSAEQVFETAVRLLRK